MKVRLLKSYGGSHKGDVIEVRFKDGRRLIQDKVATQDRMITNSSIITTSHWPGKK